MRDSKLNSHIEPKDELTELIYSDSCHPNELLFFTIGYCNRLLKCSYMAKDILQEVALRIIEHPELLRSRSIGEKKCYIKKAIKRRVIDIARHNEVRQRYNQSQKTNLAGEADIYSQFPEKQLEEHKQLIRAALEDPIRSAMLFYSEGYSYEELAEQTGVCINTVSSRIRRGRGKIIDFCKARNKRFGAVYPNFSRLLESRRKRQ